MIVRSLPPSLFRVGLVLAIRLYAGIKCFESSTGFVDVIHG